jgi:enoyl-CoA hydratase
VSAEEAEIIIRREGRAGVITLNRPKVLNALSHGMVTALAKALDDWEHDPAVAHVVVEGAGGKAFCAGGDIRSLYEMATRGAYAPARTFWREEYILNARIKSYPKPYVALIDGIVMGGGVGVSLHGSHRVAGDRLLFAMPEVGIGFFPDVGATYALPRLPGAAGTWLAVTGDRIGADDATWLGLATHRIASTDLAAVRAALVAGQAPDQCLPRFARPVDDAPVVQQMPAIDAIFSATTVEEIVARLDAGAGAGDAFATRLAGVVRTKSPTSMKLALAQMHAGRSMSFAEAMRLEYRIVSRIVEGPDFREGVRAVIIDKDNAPRWSPATLADVSDAMVAAHLAPLPDDLPA